MRRNLHSGLELQNFKGKWAGLQTKDLTPTIQQIKLETFNFTKYGTIPATLQWVASDATSAGQRNDTTAMQTQGANAAQPSQTVFPAKLQLTGKEIFIDGKSIKLGAGLNVTAEIKTGRRRVAEYLLSPIQKHLADSFSER